MKRLMAPLNIVLALSLLLAACGPPATEAPTERPVTAVPEPTTPSSTERLLVVAPEWITSFEEWETLIGEFENENPDVELEIFYSPDDTDFTDLLETTRPDVVILPDPLILEEQREKAISEFGLADLTPYELLLEGAVDLRSGEYVLAVGYLEDPLLPVGAVRANEVTVAFLAKVGVPEDLSVAEVPPTKPPEPVYLTPTLPPLTPTPEKVVTPTPTAKDCVEECYAHLEQGRVLLVEHSETEEGDCREGIRLLRLAIEQATTALEIKPGDADACFCRGMSRRWLEEELNEAIQDLECAVEGLEGDARAEAETELARLREKVTAPISVSMGPITCAEGWTEDNQPINPGTTFPANSVTEIWCNWDLYDPGNEEGVVKWYHDGKHVCQHGLVFEYDWVWAGSGWIADREYIESGTWCLEVWIGTKEMNEACFTIEVPVIDLSTDLDEQNEPIGGATSFPEGAERICGSFLPGSDISARDLGWVALDDGLLMDDEFAREFLAASESGRVGFCIYSTELSPGEHTIEVYDTDGNLIASGRLEVEE